MVVVVGNSQASQQAIRGPPLATRPDVSGPTLTASPREVWKALVGGHGVGGEKAIGKQSARGGGEISGARDGCLPSSAAVPRSGKTGPGRALMYYHGVSICVSPEIVVF